MPTAPSKRATPGWLAPMAVIVLAIVLITIAVVSSRGSESSQGGSSSGSGTSNGTGGAAQPGLADVAERRDPADLLATGPVDAPVVLVVFSDYQCPFCAKWNAQTLPSMMEYVESGDLRIEWRDVNVYGPPSERASRASYAAALQGEFWQYHDALFAEGKTRSSADLSEDALIALAGDLGLDTDTFATDMASEETVTQIAANQKLGLDLGASSTPVFILGGQPIVGAQPTTVFQDAFQAALDATK